MTKKYWFSSSCLWGLFGSRGGNRDTGRWPRRILFGNTLLGRDARGHCQRTVGIGMGLVIASALQGIARPPELQSKLPGDEHISGFAVCGDNFTVLDQLYVLLTPSYTVSPPSMVKICPVMNEAARWPGRGRRRPRPGGRPFGPGGSAFHFLADFVAQLGRHVGGDEAGATALTVTFRLANSRATVRVRPITPAFEAE